MDNLWNRLYFLNVKGRQYSNNHMLIKYSWHRLSYPKLTFLVFCIFVFVEFINGYSYFSETEYCKRVQAGLDKLRSKSENWIMQHEFIVCKPILVVVVCVNKFEKHWHILMFFYFLYKMTEIINYFFWLITWQLMTLFIIGNE